MRVVRALFDDISIHAPHARSDAAGLVTERLAERISIHAPHARSDPDASAVLVGLGISIHAPHARSDWYSSALADATL